MLQQSVDERSLKLDDGVDALARPAERARKPLAELRRDPRWQLVFAEDGILVLRRR